MYQTFLECGDWSPLGYRKFRGRDPKVEALMKKRGFSS
jgi:Zn-dependent oligopeptidase